MKRIKHNDLTHYFLRPHSELPQAYLASCEKFFRELGKKEISFKLQAAMQQDTIYLQRLKQQAASTKLQAPSLTSFKQQAIVGL